MVYMQAVHGSDLGGAGRYHGVMWGVVSSAPLGVVNSYLLSFHQQLRNKYYKKLERDAKKQ